MITFCIIIPTYNQLPLLKRALESVLHQQGADYGYVRSNAYTFANGKTLTLTVRPLQQGIYRGKLVELHHGNGQITVPEAVQNGGQMTYTFSTDHINVMSSGNDHTLLLNAFFDLVPVAAKFRLNAKTGIEYNVYFNGVKQDQYTVTTTTGDQDVIVPFGKTVKVEAHTVLVNGKEGYAITNETKGSFDLVDDSTRTKSQMAVKEVYVTDGMTSEALQTEIGTQPTATKLYYRVTVQQARGDYSVNISYYNQNAEYVTSTASNSTFSRTSMECYVWQGNPVITYADDVGSSYKEATTNATMDYANSQITITDNNAVITVGGYASMTINNFPANTKVYVTIGDSPETEVDLYTRTKLVPYNYDEATGTDVKVTVMSRDTDGKRYCMSDINEHNKKGYDIEEGMIATKTATLHNSVSELTDSLIPLPTPVRCYPVKIDAKAGGKVKVRWADTAYDGYISNRIIADEEDYCLVDDTTFSIEAIPNDGYTFKNWNLDDSLDNRCLTETVSDSILSSYEAYFVKEHTLTVTATTGGSVTVSGPGITGNDTVAAGETKTYTVRNDATNKIFTLSAEAADENHFVEWSGALTGITAADQTVTMDGDKTVTASFEANGITVTLDTSRSLDNSGKKWSTDDPSLYVRYSKADNDGDNGYIKMTKNSTDNYSALIPNGYTKVIFIKSNDGNAPDSNWTNVDKQAPTGNDRYTISETDKDWVIVGWNKAIKKATTTVNFWLNGQDWTADSAGIYIYYFNSDYDNGWIEMDYTSGTGAQSRYSAVVPAGYENIKFVRTNGSGNYGWGANVVWNETNNCSIAPGTTSSFKLNNFTTAVIE